MNWSRAKTILIVILSLLNLFLCVNVLMIEREQNYLSQEMITDASAVLKTMGIVISPETVPNRYYRLSTVHFDDLDEMRKTIALRLLGEGYTTEKAMESGETIFENETAGIIFDQDQRLEYRLKPTTPYEIRQTSEKENSALLRAMMKKLGVKTGDYTLLPSHSANGFTYTDITQQFHGIPLYDYHLSVSVTGGVIVEISGSLILGEGVSEAVIDTKDAINVLFNLAENTSASYGTILSMELGYIPGDDRMQSVLSLFPAWKIQCENESTYYYDTVTGNVRREVRALGPQK